MNTKVRLVRCPRCRQVLPELADVPVYACGGCGAILQAKNRKVDMQDTAQDTGLRVHEAYSIQKNDKEHVSEGKNEKIPSTDESDLGIIRERGESDMDSRREFLADVNESNGFHGSPAISCQENTGSSPESRAHTEAEEDKFPSCQYGSKDRNDSWDDDSKHPRDKSVSKNISLHDLDLHDDKSSAPGSATYENGSFFSSPRKLDESRCSSANNSDGDCDKHMPMSRNFSGAVSSYDECALQETGNLSPAAGEVEEADDGSKNPSTFSPRGETFLETNPKDQISAVQSSSSESVAPENYISPSTVPIEKAQNRIVPSFQRVSSADTWENVPQYSKTDLGVKLRSPTARKYYDYDDSVSSCNEADDQVPTRQFHQFKRNLKDADTNSSKATNKGNEYVQENVMSSESELLHRTINSLATLSAKKHYTTKGSKWHRDQFQEPLRQRPPVRSMMNMEADDYISRRPLYSKSSQAGYGIGNTSSYGQKSLIDKTIDPESDKMELLRMVYELQDQLNKTQMSKGMPHGLPTRVAMKEERMSTYSVPFSLDRETYPDLKYTRHPGRYDLDETLFQQGKLRRMAFSGDSMHYRHQVDCSCLHCYRQDWRYSAQLPPRVCFNRAHSLIPPRHNSRSPYESASAYPPYAASEYSLLSSDTKSENQQHHNHKEKKKLQPAKRHVRPISGGAPIIACFLCAEMLHLPADFLLFKRRYHRLRCSACSEVLKFSLENNRHIIQYTCEPATPPPSEVDDFTETRNLTSASRVSHCPHADPVSYSDDYGWSFCRSCSTDMEHFSVARPFETLNRISGHKKLSASSSFESKKEGKKSTSAESGNKHESHAETFDLAGPSSKMSGPANSSSEIEEVSPPSVSPLHQLMGYSSPGRLVYKDQLRLQ